MVKDLLLRVVHGLDLHFLFTQGVSNRSFVVHGTAVHRNGAVLHVFRSDRHIGVLGHREGLALCLGQVELLCNVLVVHSPADELPAIAACSLKIERIACSNFHLLAGMQLVTFVIDRNVIALAGRSIQRNIVARHEELKFRVILVAMQFIRQGIGTGPTLKLPILGDIGLDRDPFALNESTHDLVVHSDGVQLVILCRQRNIALGNGDGDFLIRQLFGTVGAGHFPVGEPLAIHLVGGDGDAVAVQSLIVHCGGAVAVVDGNGAVLHLDGFQRHIARRHLELDGGLAGVKGEVLRTGELPLNELPVTALVFGINGDPVASLHAGGALAIDRAASHRDGEQGLGHCDERDVLVHHLEGEGRALPLIGGQADVIAFPAVELARRDAVFFGVDGDRVALNVGIRQHGTCTICTDHGNGVQGLVFGRQSHIAFRHKEGDVLTLLLGGRQGDAIGLPAHELLTIRHIGVHGDFFACEGRGHIGMAAIHRDGVQLIVARLQLHILVRHDEGGFLVVHTGDGHIIGDDFPPHELIARALGCLDGDLVAFHSLLVVGTIDGVGALVHHDVVQGLILCRERHAVLRHFELNGRGGFLLVGQAIDTHDIPASKLLTLRCGVCGGNDLVALDGFGGRFAVHGIGTVVHGDGLQRLILCFHLNFACRHIEGSGVAVLVGQGHLVVQHIPAFELAARDGVGGNGDRGAFLCKGRRCGTLEHGHIIELIVAVLQLHVAIRHGEGGRELICIVQGHAIGADGPACKLKVVALVRCRHGDGLACVGFGEVCAVHLESAAFRHRDAVQFAGHDVEVACICGSGDRRNARVVLLTICGSEVNVILAIVGDTVCGTLGCILILDGHLAGIVENSRTVNGAAIVVLADQLYAGSMIHGQVAVYCQIFTGNTQLTGAGDIYISENRFGRSAGKGHIRCGFNDQLTLEHRVCATIQNDIRPRCIDGQSSHIEIVQAQGVGVRVVAHGTIEDLILVQAVDSLAVHHRAILFNVGLGGVLISVGIQIGQAASEGVCNRYLTTFAANSNISGACFFQGNIAAGDLNIFTVASRTPAADCCGAAVSSAGFCIYRTAFNGNICAISLEAAANASRFCTGNRFYIAAADSDIRTALSLAAADACTPAVSSLATGSDCTSVDGNIIARLSRCTANACTAFATIGAQLAGTGDGQRAVIVCFLHTGVILAAVQFAFAFHDQHHVSADGDGRLIACDLQIIQVHIRSRTAVALDRQIVLCALAGDYQCRTLLWASVALHYILYAVRHRNLNITCCNIKHLSVFRDTVLLVQPCNAAAAVDAQLHQRIGAFGQCRGRQREHHARCQSSGCCALGQFLLSHLYSPFTFTARTGL